MVLGAQYNTLRKPSRYIVKNNSRNLIFKSKTIHRKCSFIILLILLLELLLLLPTCVQHSG